MYPTYKGPDRKWVYLLLLPSPYYDELLCTSDVNRSTSSDQTLRCIENWLDECKHGHQCHRSEQLITQPARLLDLGPSQTNSDPRLIEREEIPALATYMTLSHCWGDANEVFKLVESNLQDLKRGIPTSQLSKTFQDAIRVTRKLQVRYLWIDSICIMQDSPDDWEQEAWKMGNVYNNSFLNIAASSASDGRGGLFFNRDPRVVQSCNVRATWDSEEPQNFICTDAWGWINYFDAEPLNKRAWVVQERILAPRVCHFTRSQIIWECCELFACERFPKGSERPGKLLLFSPPDAKKLTSFSMSNSDRLSLKVYLYCWADIVKKYSGSNLTKESDRLVAISGVVERMQTLLKDEYLVGMWRTRLEIQLLWRVAAGSQSFSQPLSYVAPSWSWLSLNGVKVELSNEIHRMGSSECRLLARVDSVQVLPPQSMTSCTDASIQLRCFMIPITSIMNPSIDICNFEHGGVTSNERITCVTYLDRPEKSSTSRSRWGVPILLSNPMNPNPNQAWHVVRGLLVEADESNVFRRCGTFHVFHVRNDIEKFWKSALQYGESMLLNNPRNLDVEVCDQIWTYKEGSENREYELRDNIPQFKITIK